MNNQFDIFVSLSQIFHEYGYSLYLIGGSSRDYLLKLPLSDMDIVTDATPDEIKTFLKDADYTFAKFGSIRYLYQGIKFDITTLRKENDYNDARHPKQVEFIKDLKIDVLRRDFTVNAIYIDSEGNIYDYVDGQNDLMNKRLVMIGDPNKRIKEDPLRIIRAIRFAIDYDFIIEDSLYKAILDNISLLKKINIEKIKQDMKKIKCPDKEKINKYFIKFHIKDLLDVIE